MAQQPTAPMMQANRSWRWLILALTLGLAAWFQIAAWMPAPEPASPPAGGNDLKLYRAILERMLAGEPYWQAAGIELRAGGYPTGSVFNWRPPLYAWLVHGMGSLRMWQLLVGITALGVLYLTFGLVRKQAGLTAAMVGLVLQAGGFAWCIDGDAYLAQELFAGILMALSVAAYGRGQVWLGFTTAAVGLFLRELLLPYAILCLALALLYGRRREARAWAGVFLCYGAYLAYHFAMVRQQMQADDRVGASWVQMGGATFLLKTLRMNEILFRWPMPLIALYGPIAWLGAWGWAGEARLRLLLGISGYWLAFCIVGQPFNDYWGLLYAGLLPMGAALAPAMLPRLIAGREASYNVDLPEEG